MPASSKISRGRPPLTPGALHTERVTVYIPEETKRLVESIALHFAPGPVTSAEFLRRAFAHLLDHVQRTDALPAKAATACDGKLVALVTPAVKTTIDSLADHFSVSSSELLLRALQAYLQNLAPEMLRACDEAEAHDAAGLGFSEPVREALHASKRLTQAHLDARRT